MIKKFLVIILFLSSVNLYAALGDVKVVGWTAGALPAGGNTTVYIASGVVTQVSSGTVGILGNVKTTETNPITSISVSAVTSSSPTAKVTTYSGDTEIMYSTSVIKDQNYGIGTQLAANSTFYWTIFDGTQTKDYYLKELHIDSDANSTSAGTFVVLYTGGDGSTDLQNLNGGSAAFANHILICQIGDKMEILDKDLHDWKISAGTVLRLLATNTSANAGDFVANLHYVEKQ